MIIAEFERTKNGSIIAFHIEGHAGFAKKGRDIVCAAVSALAINCVNSIEMFTDDEILLEEQDDKKGCLDFRLKSEPSEKASLLLESMLFGIRGVAEEPYGNGCISIIERECESSV